MKKTQLFLTGVMLLYTLASFSQENTIYPNKNLKNIIYGSLGLNLPEFYIPSGINYERSLYDSGFVKLNGRTGAGFWIYWTESGINIPLTGQIVFFKKASHLEIGIGGQYIYDFSGGITMLSHLLNIGYRYQKFNGKFIFRIGFEKNYWLAYPFISFGTVF